MRREYASDRFFRRGERRLIRTFAEWISYLRHEYECSTEEAEEMAQRLIDEGQLIGPVGEPA